MNFFESVLRGLQSFLMLPAKLLLGMAPRFLGVIFLGLIFLLGSVGFVWTEGWPAFLFLFWICLGLSLVNHKIHQDKYAFIEGQIREEDCAYLVWDRFFTPFFFLLVYISLFSTLILLLRQATLFWGETLFASSSFTISDWSFYALDLILKAVLFDIPEIYQWDLSSISHQGFWGGTLVLVSRLILLVLIGGALLRWREVRQMTWQAITMLNSAEMIAEIRLLKILKMYPRQIAFLRHLCLSPKSITHPSDKLIEILGKTQHSSIQAVLETLFIQNTSLSRKLAVLKGLEYFGKGDPALFVPLFSHGEKEYLPLKQQACRVLGIWNTENSIRLLVALAEKDHDESVRKSAIESLGLTRNIQALAPLCQIVFQETKSKEERFAAKEAVGKIGALTPILEKEVQYFLQHSPFADNRRFAAMILGDLVHFEYFSLFHQCVLKEQDADTQVYLLKGIGALAHSAKKQLKEIWKIIPEQDWINLFFAVKKEAFTGEKIFVQVAAIQTLVDFSWLFTEFLVSEEQLIPELQELSKHSDTQLADVAADALTRLSEYIHSIEVTRRRYSITAISLGELSWRASPTPIGVNALSIPTPPPPIPMKKQFATTLVPIEKISTKKNTSRLLPFPETLRSSYLLQRVLHKGKVSQVVLVVEVETQKEQVLKYTVRPENWARQMLLHEIAVLQSCVHPQIPPLLKSYSEEAFVGFTMPWISSQTLFQVQDSRKQKGLSWSLPEVLHLLHLLCSALSALHRAGWYHKDIKPENIMVQEKELFLIDFNSAEKYSTSYDRSEPFAIGSPYYMAPEQMNQLPCSFHVDIYSLGILTYELFTGVLPVGVAPLMLSDLRPDLPVSIQAILEKATHFSPEKRYATPLDFWEALHQTLLE